MVHVDFSYAPDEFSLTVSGHAGYAAKGNDIVCAGVSALTAALFVFTERNVSLADAGLFIKRTADGFAALTVAEIPDEKLRLQLAAVFSACISGLIEIEQQYPDYIKIRDITSQCETSDIDTPEQTENMREGRGE